MTAPQTNKRATAKNLLAARITLVEELGDALDAHSKAVAAAAQARQHAEKTTDAARTAFEAAKASGPPPNSTAPDCTHPQLRAGAQLPGTRCRRTRKESAGPTTAGDSPAAPAGDDAADSAA